ncbi:MAG: acylphosphatase [Euryarchaeota archaeon]|nr:acylphosphatase [Euryarchaeota archaeon]
MKRANIIVKGEVQRVGYRDAVVKLARKLKIVGFVENLKHYDVRIIAEGEDANIDLFIERIEIRKFPMDVESTEVSFETYDGEFEYFEIKRGDWHEELLERLDTAGTLLYKSVELGERSVALGEESVALSERSVALGEESVALSERSVALGERSVALSERSVALGEKTVALSERSVALGEESVALGEESVGIGEKMLEKQDKTIDAIDRSKEEIVTQISSLRDDSRSYMGYKFAKIEHEVEAIKAKIGMI